MDLTEAGSEWRNFAEFDVLDMFSILLAWSSVIRVMGIFFFQMFEGRRGRPSACPIEKFYRVRDRGRRPLADLHGATDIAGRDDVRLEPVEIGGLPLAELTGDVGLKDIIGARRSAA